MRSADQHWHNVDDCPGWVKPAEPDARVLIVARVGEPSLWEYQGLGSSLDASRSSSFRWSGEAVTLARPGIRWLFSIRGEYSARAANACFFKSIYDPSPLRNAQ